MSFETIIGNIPDFIVNFYKSIKNSYRVKILETIYELGEITISKLESITFKKSGYITSQVHILEKANLVQNYIIKKNNSREYSFFRLTEIGKIFYRFFIILNSKKYFAEDFDRLIIKSLGNKFRFALMLYLYENGETSFSKLVNEVNKKGGELTHHLRLLEQSDMIINKLVKKDSSSDFSFYKISQTGENIVLITSQIYNFSVGNHEYLESYLKELSVDKNMSSKLINTLKSNDVQTLEEKSSISVHFATWTLPNEPILGWIKILDTKINKISLSLSENIEFVRIYNKAEFSILNKEKEVVFKNIITHKINYYSIELNAKIPIGQTIINKEVIIAKMFDENNEIIEEKSLSIEVIKPIITLDAKNTNITSKQGYFDLLLSIPKGYNLKLGKMRIIAKDSQGNLMKIEQENISVFDLPNQIPNELETNDLIGNIKFNGTAPFYVKFILKYFDAVENEYESESMELKILGTQLKKNLLNLNYNFQAAPAVA